MAQENLAGRTIKTYRLLERVGEGGTAIVYRAEKADGGLCAVKVLKQRLRNDKNAVERFLREAEYGSRVEHDGVVRTYEFGQVDDLYFLALQWASGDALADFVRKAGKLAPELVALIIAQLAGALDAAHQAGIIHRDLKPENIIYDSKTREAKLLDFGIARDAEMDPAQRLTRTGFFVGTLQYVAPEALSGELVGPSADIYSLATITFYLLTGLHPFDGKSPRELFKQLLTEDARPLNQAAKGLKFSAALEKAVMHGLEREPGKRPSSVLEFAHGIETAISNADGPSGKGGIMGVFKGFLRRD